MPTSDWSIPTGKAITGTTYIKDTDNNIAATIEDLVDWCNNANGTYNDYTLTGLRTDFISVSTAQAITSVKTIDTGGAIDFTNGELRIGGVAVTSTAAELNFLDGSVSGTVVNGKAPIYGAAGELNATKLQVGGSDITSTPAEINLTDGSIAGTIVNSKAVIYGAAGEVNATKLQVGGVDILSTPAELNLLDGSASDTVVNGKAVIYGAAGEVSAASLTIGGVDITASGTEINYLDGVTSDIQTQIDAAKSAATDIMIVRDEKTSGTGGGTFTSGAWRTRDLNTVNYNSISGASLATNQITLPAGTYEVYAEGMAYGVNVHQTRIYDTTNTVELALGLLADQGAGDTGTSPVFGVFTLAGTAAIELQHRGGSSSTYGLASGWGTEVYSHIILRKIA